MFQVSKFEISPHISDFRRLFSYFLDYDDSDRRGSRGGEMGEFSPPPPPFRAPFFFFFFLLSPQPGFGSTALLQKFTPYLKILDPRLSEPREHWLCQENFTFGQKKFKVWHLKYKRLRSRKLKFGRENFKVWHLKHRHLTSVENMFLARAFTGRCNRR